ncbi:phage baseplate protein [Bradyrhizobium sp.]
MPDVPQVPGVPQLSSYSANSVVLLVADAISAFSGLFGPTWGIFLDGTQAFAYNSIVDFDYKQDWPVSDYPVEDGGFLSYDKVQLPFDVKVRVASGGSESDRQDLLTSVLAAANMLSLYDVVTPEQTYSSCNITHVDFKRTNTNGVGMILIDIWFIEIRVTSTSNFSNTQTPAVAGKQGAGLVSATDAPTSITSKVSGGGVQ